MPSSHKNPASVLQASSNPLSAAPQVSLCSAESYSLDGDLLCSVEWTVEDDQVLLHSREAQSGKPTVQSMSVEALLQRVDPADRRYVERMVSLLIDGELDRCELEFRVLDATGESCWVYGKGTVQHDSTSQTAKIVGVVVYTKHHAPPPSEVGQASSDRSVGLPVGVIQFHLSTGHVSSANPAARHILELPAHATPMSLPDTGTAEWASMVELLRRQKQILSYALRLPSLNRWVLFSGRCDDGDQVTAALQDVSLIKDEHVVLQRVNTELDNFVYHASHDLRAPLRSILGSLSLLKQEDSPEERSRCVELIEGSISRLDTFITDLLSISRNQRRENPLVSINFMVELEQAIAGAYHVGSTQNLEIITKVSQPCPFVADLTRVRIVLNNLVANAIKYRRYNTSRSHITIEVWVDQNQAHISIDDNGEGIAEEHIDYIFDMFYRASERSEGSGLGLYIVKDVVQKLSGDISVRSQLGKGTTFSLRLSNHRTTH